MGKVSGEKITLTLVFNHCEIHPRNLVVYQHGKNTVWTTLWFHMLISFCSQFQKMYVVFNQADVQLLTNDRSSLKQVRALLGSCDFSKGHNTMLYSPNGWHLLRRLYQWKKHRTASSWKNQCEAAMMCSKKKTGKILATARFEPTTQSVYGRRSTTELFHLWACDST